jgi:hypothetical protein
MVAPSTELDQKHNHLLVTQFTMPTESHICPITTDLPTTIVRWHAYSTALMHGVWEQALRDWFSLEGLPIFNPQPDSISMIVTPPVNELRAPNGMYSTHYGPLKIRHEHRICEHVPLHPVLADISHT